MLYPLWKCQSQLRFLTIYNALARKNSDFVTSEISELLSSGRIREVSHNDVHTINLLSVADNGEKLKLILDLRQINQLLRVPKIKL